MSGQNQMCDRCVECQVCVTSQAQVVQCDRCIECQVCVTTQEGIPPHRRGKPFQPRIVPRAEEIQVVPKRLFWRDGQLVERGDS